MIYAIILAGGSGQRMKNSLIPKQFIRLKDKPIIIYTIEKFLLVKEINKIIIPCKKEWIIQLKKIIKEYIADDKIDIIEGGDSRNMSIRNSIEYLKKFKPYNEDIVITHDGVRPFISAKIIKENIKQAKRGNIVIDTCVKAIDTIVECDEENVKNIPNRDRLYIGQTPQTCNFLTAKNIYSKKYDEYLFSSTDLCKLAIDNNIPIKIVKGNYFNIKITTDFDIFLFELIRRENG